MRIYERVAWPDPRSGAARIIHVNWGYCLTEMGRYRLLAACVLLAIASVSPGSGEGEWNTSHCTHIVA